MSFHKVLIGLAALCVTGASQAAQTFQFVYNNAAGQLSGRFTGTLQGDGNTIFVASVDNYLKFNGVAGPALPDVTTLAAFLGIAAEKPYVKLDGSGMDVLACTNISCSGDLILFDGFGIYAGVPAFFASAGFSGTANLYAQGSGTVSAVPDAGVWALLTTGLGLTGALLRRRRDADGKTQRPALA